MIKIGDRVKNAKTGKYGTVTHLHDRGGKIEAVACRVSWDGMAYQYDAKIADLIPLRFAIRFDLDGWYVIDTAGSPPIQIGKTYKGDRWKTRDGARRTADKLNAQTEKDGTKC